MKRILQSIGWLLLIALNWVALHDILEGEADVRGEWAIVVATVVLVATYWALRPRRRRPPVA